MSEEEEEENKEEEKKEEEEARNRWRASKKVYLRQNFPLSPLSPPSPWPPSPHLSIRQCFVNIHYYQGENLRLPIASISSKGSDSLLFSPPLPFPSPPSLSIYVSLRLSDSRTQFAFHNKGGGGKELLVPSLVAVGIEAVLIPLILTQ